MISSVAGTGTGDSPVMLTGKTDIYDCLMVRSFDFPNLKPETAKLALNESIKQWTEAAKYRGIWFRMEINDNWWLPVLLGEGFEVHHTKADYIILTKWLVSGRPSTMPIYPFTSLGVGGIVTNSKDELLMIREKRGHYLGWKFPGGLVNPDESIPLAVSREVLEETGVQAEFLCILGFRHSTKSLFEKTGDIYFICAMKPKDENELEVTPCPHEIAESKWMSRAQIDALNIEIFHDFVRNLLKRYDEWKASDQKGISLHEISNETRQIYT